MVIEIALLPPSRGLLNFGEHFGDESLSAETRVHGHDQELIDLREIRFDVADRSGRIQRQANFHTQGADLPKKLLDPVAQFDVDDHSIRASFGERLQEDFRPGAH